MRHDVRVARIGMSAAQSLSAPCRQYVSAVCRGLAVRHLLHGAVSTLLAGSTPALACEATPSVDDSDDLNPDLSRQQLQSQREERDIPQADLQNLFYRDYFPALAEVLLNGKGAG